MRVSLPFLCLFILGLSACGPDDDDPKPTGPETLDFNRQEMLTGWVDDYVIEGHTASLAALSELDASLTALADGVDSVELAAVRTDFTAAYVTWQKQAPFLLAEAEALNLRENVNTYPANVELIDRNVAAGNTNLELPSNITAQGFPALEYLLFADRDGKTNVESSPGAVIYAAAIVDRMQDLQTRVLAAVEANRISYIENDGNSATASIDRTVNDFIFYYEKFLRAGKVGIPAGVFSDDPLADRVESRYQGNSKALFLTGLQRSREFFRAGGLSEYLTATEALSGASGETLSQSILSQFDAIATAAEGLEDDFGVQVATDNIKMLALFDEMQKLTVLLKVDMLQTLSINVDFVDADGD